MKKLVSMILVGASVLSLCACGGGSSTPATTQAPADTTAVPADSKAEETTTAAAQEPLLHQPFRELLHLRSFG